MVWAVVGTDYMCGIELMQQYYGSAMPIGVVLFSLFICCPEYRSRYVKNVYMQTNKFASVTAKFICALLFIISQIILTLIIFAILFGAKRIKWYEPTVTDGKKINTGGKNEFDFFNLFIYGILQNLQGTRPHEYKGVIKTCAIVVPGVYTVISYLLAVLTVKRQKVK